MVAAQRSSACGIRLPPGRGRGGKRWWRRGGGSGSGLERAGQDESVAVVVVVVAAEVASAAADEEEEAARGGARHGRDLIGSAAPGRREVGFREERCRCFAWGGRREREREKMEKVGGSGDTWGSEARWRACRSRRGPPWPAHGPWLAAQLLGSVGPSPAQKLLW